MLNKMRYANILQNAWGSFLPRVLSVVRMTIFIYWLLRKLQISKFKYQISYIKKGSQHRCAPFFAAPLLGLEPRTL